MGTGGGRRGRRDNGLVAAEYAVVGDVDPRVGEHLLDVLAAGGIAAYLQPAADLHPVTRTTTLPSRPADRLYVDREHLDTARDYLAQVTESAPPSPDAPEAGSTAAGGRGGGTGLAGPAAGSAVDPDGAPGAPDKDADGLAAADRIDVDAEFARIVAGFDTDFGTDVETEVELRRPAARADGRRTDDRDTKRGEEEQQASLLDGLDRFGTDLPDDDQDSYTPPPPPPLPRLSAAAIISLLAVVCGFVLFLSPGLVPLHLNHDLVRMLGLAGCAAGVAGLIWRLRPGDEDDEYYDPDDGARV